MRTYRDTETFGENSHLKERRTLPRLGTGPSGTGMGSIRVRKAFPRFFKGILSEEERADIVALVAADQNVET
jgi:hypothetical protein